MNDAGQRSNAAEDLADIGQQVNRFRGWLEAAADALEQTEAKLLFHALQHVAHGRLADVQKLHRPRHGAGLHQRMKDLQLT